MNFGKTLPPLARIWTTLILIGLVFATSGCDRSDPHVVKAKTPLDFVAWRARAQEQLPTQDWKEFDTLVQEIRFDIMANHEATGSDAVDVALRERIDGHTMNEVMRLGLEGKLNRLDAERAQVEDFMQKNSQLQTREGDTASADYLAKKRTDQTAKRDRLKTEIAANEKRWREFGGTGSWRPTMPTRETK
jgi:hypothetical protein